MVTYLGAAALLFASLMPRSSSHDGISAGPQTVDCRAALMALFKPAWRGSPNQRTEQIKHLAPACAGTTNYQLGLSTAYLDASRYADALRAAQKALGIIESAHTGSPRSHDGIATGEDKEAIEAHELMFRSLVAMGKMQRSNAVAERVIRRYPASAVGYLLKGRYLSDIGDFADSIHELDRSLSIEASSEAYLYLTIDGYDTGDYAGAARAFDAGAALLDAIWLNRNAVLAAAASNLRIGRFQRARAVLDRHARIDPSIRSDPLFKAISAALDRTLPPADTDDGGRQGPH